MDYVFRMRAKSRPTELQVTEVKTIFDDSDKNRSWKKKAEPEVGYWLNVGK